uniref:Uncharacterized protein n=1 Tax=Oryza glumipatula TaxID=40148 RepID=A0A0E0BGF8_9ORYZ
MKDRKTERPDTKERKSPSCTVPRRAKPPPPTSTAAFRRGAMLHLRRRLLPLLRVPSSPHASASASASSYAHLRRLRLHLSTAAPFSAEDYLVATCGLTGDQAFKASKKISHLRSAANPDAVLAALSGVGLSRADLAAVVASDPHLLCARPDNVSRRVASLRDRVGLSDPQIGRFLLAGGAMAVRKCDVAERLEFWIPFLGGSFETLLKMLRRNNAIVRADVEKVIKPNIALFQECGLTVRDIVKMPGWLFTFNPKRVEAAVERTGKLGVELASSRLKYMLSIAGNITEGNASARMKYLSSTLNCSMDKVEYMVGKMPTIITLSEEKLRSQKAKIAHSTLPNKIPKPSLAVAGDMLRLSFCRPTAGGGLAGAMLHLLPLLRARAATHLPTSSSSLHLSRRRLLLLSTAARSAAATPFSVEEYLVDTCGLTGAQALKASKKVSHLKSAANPDTVLAVLSGVGLSRADLAAVVAAEPQLLCARADNIARRIASLRDRVGLSDPQIGSFLLVAGGAKGIHACDVAPRLEFWIPFLGSFETLLRILKGNNVLVLSDLEKVIKPNIALLQECGLTVCDIVKMARFAPRMFTSNPKQVEGFVRRADELGVPRTSGQFKYMVGIFANISEGSATARMEYLSRSLGCSMDKLRSAVQKLPQILGLSETNLGSKIEFLVGKVRLEPEYLLKTPKLFTYSLEKRLVARHYIVQDIAIVWF